MLLVETYIAHSPGKGIGLFSRVAIQKGTIYWVRNEIFDKIISPEQINTFTELAANYIFMHGFKEISGNWYLCSDNARFSNHSKNPNSLNHFDLAGLIEYSYAAKDIASNEEILCDYTNTCQTCINGVPFDDTE
jgi:SET domain-containing protein